MLVGVLGCMAERLKSKFLEEEKLVDIVVGPDAYRALRKAQHAARLNEEPTQCPPEVLASEQSAIRALWQVVFPQDTA